MRWSAVVGVGLVAGGVALAGCTAEPGMVWMRKDGQPVDARFHGAIGQCREVAAQVGAVSPGPQRQELMVAAMEGCMARRGYKWGCRHSLANPLDGECLVNLPAT